MTAHNIQNFNRIGEYVPKRIEKRSPEIINQEMLYNNKDDRRSLTIVSPSRGGMNSMVVVMHAHTDGYWHSSSLRLVRNIIIYLIYYYQIFSSSQNYLKKIGDVCYISTLPNDLYPYEIARGIQDIKEGNDLTTKDDEKEEHKVLLDDGPLSYNEEYGLHSDIKSHCKGITLRKFVEFSVPKYDIERLRKGGMIYLKGV